MFIMHPVEAISILSQLAYVQPDAATSFADQYAWHVGFGSLPVHAPTAPYTPLYHEYTYASTFRLETNTPNQFEMLGDWVGTNPELISRYNPDLVGRQPGYEHTLFLMTRDMAVLNALNKVKPSAGFYCVWNAEPIKSDLSEAAFKVEFNFNTVYPCTGPVHDAHVPKCVCPVPPPPLKLTALAERIKAHRAAAPFAVRLSDLYAAVADAHKTAKSFEVSMQIVSLFPRSALLANYTFEKWSDLGIDLPRTANYNGFRLGDWIERRNLVTDLLGEDSVPNGATVAPAAAARVAADAAEAKLAAYIAEKEDAAFAAFKPEVRSVLTTLRTNTLAGYTVPMYPITVDDVNPLLIKLDPPQNKWSNGED